MFRTLLTALALAGLASPVSAATFLTFGFGRTSGTVNIASVASTVGGTTLTATALRFTAVPDMLTSLSQTSVAGQIQQTVPGIGIKGGASDPQLDTNTPTAREGILISGNRDFALAGLKLSYIDADDTLQIYGVNADGSLVALGFGGTIKAGVTGASSSSFTTVNSGTVKLIFAGPTARFDRFLFTTRIGGETLFMGARGQGYRLDSITAEVPEPGTWR